MTASILKKKLVQAIDEIDDTDFLKALHTIVQSKNEEPFFEPGPAQKKELERRRSNHLNGKSKSYTWAEVKKAAIKRKA